MSLVCLGPVDSYGLRVRRCPVEGRPGTACKYLCAVITLLVCTPLPFTVKQTVGHTGTGSLSWP